jgi:hypothetical protein
MFGGPHLSISMLNLPTIAINVRMEALEGHDNSITKKCLVIKALFGFGVDGMEGKMRFYISLSF